jgi:thiol-disulfide isomerase/thioredoxin
MRYLLSILLSILSLQVLAQAIPYAPAPKGIHFEHSNWAEVMQKAKTEHKGIFIDCYTSWCGPCKWMAANVFTDDTVGLLHNNNYINFKQDMEKGEGPGLSQQFGIYAYPTMIYFDEDARILNKQVGGLPVPEFILKSQEALKFPNLSDMIARFEKGEKDSRFLVNLLIKLPSNNPMKEKVLRAYFSGLKEEQLSEEVPFMVMNLFEINVLSNDFVYLMKNRALFEGKYGKEKIEKLINKVANASLKLAEAQNDKKLKKQAEAILNPEKK